MTIARVAVAFCIVSAVCFGAVDGTVTNGTSNKPQPAVIVTMVQPGAGGMQTLATVKSDAGGKFHIDKEGQPGAPVLLQAIYQGVLYTHMVPPGMPTNSVGLTVYDASSNAGAAPMEQHMVLLQPTASDLSVGETFLFHNASSVTYNDPANGTLRVYLPDGVESDKVAVTVTPPGGMPIQRSADKTKLKNVYKVDYPIQPGETRFDLSYTLPAESPLVYSGKTVMQGGPTRLVVPKGVSVTGDNLTSLGTEPTTQAGIFEVKGDTFKVELQGTGTLQSAQAGSEDDSGPGIQEILPKLYDREYWVIGLALGILALGFTLLYRKSSSVEAAAPPPANKSRKKRA